MKIEFTDMKIEFTDTFFKSLKRLRRHDTWWYKAYALFRHKIPWFFGNIRRFRKQLWRYRPWDSSYSLELFGKGVELNGEYILRHGKEVDESRLKKVIMIKRATELINHYTEDSYIELAERRLGIQVDSSYLFSGNEPESVTESNSRIFKLSREIEKQEWEELWEIIKGRKFDNPDDRDGSNLKSWWD